MLPEMQTAVDPSNPQIMPVASGPATPLDRLQQALLGPELWSIEKQLQELTKSHHELDQSLEQRIKAIGEALSEQTEATRTDLTAQLKQQAADQAGQSQIMAQNLLDRIDRQNHESLARLQALHTELAERLEQQANDIAGQIKVRYGELSERIEKQANEFHQAIQTMQQDMENREARLRTEQMEKLQAVELVARQKSDRLRHELLTLAAAVDHRKLSRHDLGKLLVELGQQLQGETDWPG